MARPANSIGLFARTRGLLLMSTLALLAMQSPASDCTRTSVGLIPLMDLGSGWYQGVQGGLYPKGSNTRPPAHEASGLEAARAVRPLDSAGQPDDASGKIVFLSIGMSNTTQEFSTFKPLADADADKNPRLIIVDGAQGGMTASIITNLSDSRAIRFWQTVDNRLAAASASPSQVQVAWVKEANAQPRDPFPDDARILQSQLAEIARIFKTRFPNIRIAYYSSRIYAGYASTALNPEPYSYQSGFAVKWMIEEQINRTPGLNFDPSTGTVTSPWLSWGPYLWADGLKARSDGLTYACTDFNPSDGTHPAPGGAREKVARLLLDFLKTDSTARLWFLRPEKAGNIALIYPALVARRGNLFDSSNNTSTGLATANLDETGADLALTAFHQAGTLISGAGITNPTSMKLPPGAQFPRIDYEVFGDGFAGADQPGWFRLDSTSPKIAGFFEIFNGSLTMLDGADVSSRLMSASVFPEVEAGGFMEIHVVNPNGASIAVALDLLDSNGVLRGPPAVRTVDPYGALVESLAGLFPQTAVQSSDHARVNASMGMASFALLGKADVYLKAMNGQDVTAGATTLYSPQYAVGGGWRSTLSIVNLDPDPGLVTLVLKDRNGRPLGDGRNMEIRGSGKVQIDAQDFFVTPEEGLKEGYVVISSGGIALCGSVSFGDASGHRFASALPLVSNLQRQVIFSQIASDPTWYTGLAILNPHEAPVMVTLEVHDAAGSRIGTRDLILEAGQSMSKLLTEYVPALGSRSLTSGYIRLSAAKPLASFAVYGSQESLSAVPPQAISGEVRAEERRLVRR